jgi:hypothetical protein
MPKHDLYKKLTEKYNYERLLRAEARSRRNQIIKPSRKRNSSSLDSEDNDEKEIIQQSSAHESSTSNSSSSAPPKPKKIKLNHLDPIMLTPILKKKKTFKFNRPNGSIVQFNVETLVDYLLSSGDFHDPETRLPFTDEQLKEIDGLAKELGLSKPSVYDAKRNDTHYHELKFRRDALLGLERCAGEVITDILELIEEADDPEEAQVQFVMSGKQHKYCISRVFLILFIIIILEFPSFLDYFRQIRDVDREYASKCISHWKSFIVGPPNNPNSDDHSGLMKVSRLRFVLKAVSYFV